VGVTTEHRALAENHAVADNAVVANVRACHHQAIAAEAGNAFFLFGSAIDRAIFADYVAITENDLGGTAFVGDILRLATNDCSGMNQILSAHGHMTENRDIVQQTGSGADPNIRTNDAKRSDNNSTTDFGSGIDIRQLRNLR
jgi:hypothetical protein